MLTKKSIQVKKSRHALTSASKEVDTIQLQRSSHAWWKPILAYENENDSGDKILKMMKANSRNPLSSK
jgi:hypothetical protein